MSFRNSCRWFAVTAGWVLFLLLVVCVDQASGIRDGNHLGNWIPAYIQSSLVLVYATLGTMLELQRSARINYLVLLFLSAGLLLSNPVFSAAFSD
jgi:hypothetical protein